MTIFRGDFFMYSYQNDMDPVLITEFLQEMNDKALELMQRHYEFYGALLEEDSYVTRGSILCCSAGSTESVFDLPVDHAVVRSDGAAIGICADCKQNENIISFGYCSKPTPEGYPRRSTAPGEEEKCIPMLEKGWHPGRRDDLRIYDQTQEKYFQVLTTRAFLTCFYGGLIKVAEVYEGYDKFQAIDRIEKIEKCSDKQLNTIKYVIKVLLMEGYCLNFVCGVAGNIIAEGGQAGHFESSTYGNPEERPSYLKHMDNKHYYNPQNPGEEGILEGTEHVSGHNIYDLESGTGIFSKQLGWDSENKRFVCDACGGEDDEDHVCLVCADHTFGFGMCQWSDNGIKTDKNEDGTRYAIRKGPGRLPLLITKYLEEFGEDAKPDWRECCRVETDYLCQELQYSDYSEIAGIHKEECTLEDATVDFLRLFERPKNWNKKKDERIGYAQNVLNAIKEVGGDE